MMFSQMRALALIFASIAHFPVATATTAEWYPNSQAVSVVTLINGAWRSDLTPKWLETVEYAREINRKIDEISKDPDGLENKFSVVQYAGNGRDFQGTQWGPNINSPNFFGARVELPWSNIGATLRFYGRSDLEDIHLGRNISYDWMSVTQAMPKVDELFGQSEAQGGRKKVLVIVTDHRSVYPSDYILNGADWMRGGFFPYPLPASELKVTVLGMQIGSSGDETRFRRLTNIACWNETEYNTPRNNSLWGLSHRFRQQPEREPEYRLCYRSKLYDDVPPTDETTQKKILEQALSIFPPWV